jgi:hypothetical protein
MPSVGFEPAVSAGKRPQTYALDRVATGIGVEHLWGIKKTLMFLFPSVGRLLQPFSPFKGTNFVNCVEEL